VDKAELFVAIAEQAVEDEPALAGAVMTNVIILSTWVTPDGAGAFRRITAQRDGRPLHTWDVDGMLITAFKESRRPLTGLGDT
jgi:hypothetical protein